MGAGVAVHLPVYLHGFSVRGEEDGERYPTGRVRSDQKILLDMQLVWKRKERKTIDDVMGNMQKKKKSCKFIQLIFEK